jgi:hypothetical protein
MEVLRFMSERIKQIMERYGVGLEEALEIMDRQNDAMKFIFNTFEPYGKHLH